MNGLTFWHGKSVFITGHTGFKGSWLCKILEKAGADVIGYALKPSTEPNLFDIVSPCVRSTFGDIRDFERLQTAFKESCPEIVIHMAAQPLVLESYREPRYTYDVNVMGTVNILECVRKIGGVRSFLNVTTDKVYRNYEQDTGYVETDTLDGYDPYSNSKSCSELITRTYRDCFFANGETDVSTARAGNVIGGGDFAKDRIIPDCIRAAMDNKPITVRNPRSVRPYQHVLEPLFAYLLIAQGQYENPGVADSYNVGPGDCDCVSTVKLTELFCKAWGDDMTWEISPSSESHEAGFLKLDSSKIKKDLGWVPRWSIETAVTKTVDWAKAWISGDDINVLMDKQIMEYQKQYKKVYTL